MEGNRMVASGKNKLLEYAVLIYVFCSMMAGSSGDTITKVGRVILILAFLAVNLKRVVIKKTTKFYIGWAVSFLFYAYAGCITAYSKSYATTFSITLTYVVICDIAVLLSVARDEQLKRAVLHTIVLSATCKALVCYLQYGFLYFLTTRFTETTSANTLGYYCAFACVICFYFLESQSYHRGVYGGLIFLNVVFLTLSASRKAIMFLIIPVAIMWIAKSKNPLVVIKNIFMAALAVLIILALLLNVDFLYTMMGYRVEGMINAFLGTGVVDASTNTRIGLIEDGLSWFSKKPIFGYGLSNFKALCAVYRSWGSVYYAHNNYVELLVDCGIVGTLIYYSLHIKLLWTGILNWKKMDKEQLMFLGMLLSMIICDYGMVTYFDIFSQLMLVLVYVSFSNLQHIKMQRIRQ